MVLINRYIFKYNLGLRQLNIVKEFIDNNSHYNDEIIGKLKDGKIYLELNTVVFEIINTEEIAFSKAKEYFTNFIGNGVISKIWEDAFRRYKESEISVKTVVKYNSYNKELDWLWADYRETNINQVKYDDEHETYSVIVQVPQIKNMTHIFAIIKAIPYLIEAIIDEGSEYDLDGIKVAVDKFVKTFREKN